MIYGMAVSPRVYGQRKMELADLKTKQREHNLGGFGKGWA